MQLAHETKRQRIVGRVKGFPRARTERFTEERVGAVLVERHHEAEACGLLFTQGNVRERGGQGKRNARAEKIDAARLLNPGRRQRREQLVDQRARNLGRTDVERGALQRERVPREQELAGDADALAAAVQTTGESSATLIDAAVLYIQQVLFADDADSYRLLGVRADAPKEQIQEHYRWLMRWLHPDRHPERWEVVYSDRVNRAWQTLSSMARRTAYDLSLLSARSETHPQAVQAQQMRRNALAVTGKPLLSTQLARRLPHIVLGGLGLGALLVLGLLYYLREEVPIAEPMAQDAKDTLAQAPSSDQPTPLPLDSSTRNPLHAASAAIVATSAAKPAIVPLAAMPKLLPLPTTRVVNVPALTQPMLVKPAVVRIPIAAVVAAKTDVSSRRERQTAAQVATSKELHPAAVAEDPPDTTAQSSAVVAAKPAAKTPRAAANAVSQAFVHAYVAGDLGAMMELFSVEAVGNRGGVETIAQDYDKLFRETQSRDLQLERLAWTTSEDRIIGSGPFEVILRRTGASTDQHVEGWITIEARLIDGHWRIQRLIHRNVR